MGLDQIQILYVQKLKRYTFKVAVQFSTSARFNFMSHSVYNPLKLGTFYLLFNWNEKKTKGYRKNLKQITKKVPILLLGQHGTHIYSKYRL